MFDTKTAQSIGYYVYALIDPRNKNPFYIGKGFENRVFDHVKCSDTYTIINGKFETIKDIQSQGLEVEHLIIRHGLTQEEAFKVEASIIDVLKFLKYDLTNEQCGHHTLTTGLMTTSYLQSIYKAQKLEHFLDPLIIININKTNPRSLDAISIYEATKKAWVIGKNREKVKYVLSEYRGLVVGIFEITGGWYHVDSYTTEKGKHVDRWGFHGESVKNQEVIEKYLGKSVAHFKLRGASNPIRYFI